MKMESAVPFIGMVIQQLAQVGLMVACEVTSAGLTTYTFLFYSSAISTLILIPLSFFFHRSALPPLWPTFIHGFFFLGIMGFLMQMLTLVGLRYSSPLLSTAILQLVPGFTFILAVLLRMETFEYKSLSTVAKTIGTLVSIIGALVATLYKGPDVLNSTLTSLPQFLNQPSNWVIGGLVAMIGALITSLLIISQAFVLKKYPAELIVMLYYSCGVTLLSLATCLITQRDLSSWIINTQPEILALMYSTDRELWIELEDRYGQADGARVFQLQRELNNVNQGRVWKCIPTEYKLMGCEEKRTSLCSHVSSTWYCVCNGC
ncbi:WAT1-related protein At5g40240 isoform X2 [Capsicum annuum]|uniref:WAT1-related protein At5g40240 isoform X2 n=1 Tax=Capsicum annuum TaxID=4072 RepID=UPI001FB157F4|nr:WAT1-related protein At5g40240 isoform X2 [Capsicum annuum]